jgi:hypothetical protein
MANLLVCRTTAASVAAKPYLLLKVKPVATGEKALQDGTKAYDTFANSAVEGGPLH